MQRGLLLIIILAMFASLSCRRDQPVFETDEDDSTVIPETIKEGYSDYFITGVAISNAQINGEEPQAMEIVKEQFTSITAENDMKWEYMEPTEGSFYYDDADLHLAFAEENDLTMIGHTLVWHSQLPSWVRSITDSATLVTVMKNHIDSVVGKYAGRVHGWDVINEAFEYDGSFRDTVFYKYIGESFFEQAFAAAQAADSTAELYYNDYSMTSSGKKETVINMIEHLQEKDIRIDAVCMQGHWTLTSPSVEVIEQSIIDYYNAGVKVIISELDVTVLDQNNDADPYVDGLPDDVATDLAERYAALFSLFKKHEEKIARVTLWGVHDGQSWKNYSPYSGRTDYPLLFDRDYEKKACFYSTLEAAPK